MKALKYKPLLTRYVRAPVGISRRKKITEQQAEEMKSLRRQGMGWQRIANLFGVAKTTVMYNVSPVFRLRANVSASRRSKVARATNPTFAQRHKKQTYESHRYLTVNFPPYRRYNNT